MSQAIQKKSVSKTFINLFGLGDFGFQLMVNMELLFFVVFLTDAVRFDPGTAGVIGSVTGVFDVVWVFVAAAIVQKVNFKKGKYSTWLLLFPPLIWATFIFQFWGASGATEMSAFIIVFGFVASHLVWNCVYTAHLSMISAYSDDIQQRATMSSRRMLGQALGKIVFSLVAVSLIGFFAGPNGDPNAYMYATMIIAIPCVLCYILVGVVARRFGYDKLLASPAEAGKGAAPKESLWKSIGNAIRNSQLIVLLVSDFGRCFAFYLVTAVTAYYFRIVLGDMGAMTLYLLLINIAAALGSIVAPHISKIIGKKLAYFIGFFGYAACLMIIFFIPNQVTLFMVVMFIANFVFQLSFGMGTAMFADTVIYGEHKTGVNSRGFIMGLYSLPIKLAVVVRASFIGIILAAINYTPDTITPEITNGVINLFTIYPAIALVVLGVFGLIFYRLTDKRVSQMTDELAERKLQAATQTDTAAE